MKKYLFVCVLSFLFSISARADSVVIGTSCDVIGASQMTSDQQNIAVCLKNTAGKQVWKSSTSTPGSTMYSGWPGAIFAI